MFMQSILFFILGVAGTSWILVLIAPLIWHRALHFAHKIVSTKVPLSVTEIQANYDFICAQHSVELVRNEKKYDSLQKKYSQQKIQLSRVKEQLYQLLSSTKYTSHPLHATEVITEEGKLDALTTNTFITEIKAMRKKIVLYQQRLQNIQLDKLDSALSHQLLHELREETKELAATLAAQIAMKEGQNSPINTLIKDSKSENDLAARIRKKTDYIKK
ncbi:hypothetical protein [Bartonella sp. A05]|uniref:hypothetical protein n=1 Tax=Bartonella sp. A05 TaxID=2967261 RepID=UPI0022A9ED1C|nr:hypothetical protein [Bartonella sp. A05]MCZ2204125.1 hypothetical protein [Bartonella sp. A05]